MGFFSLGKAPSSSDTFNQQEAFLAIALATTAADGRIDESEAKGIFAYLLQMKIFQGLSERQLSDMLKKLVKILEKEGVGGLVSIAKTSLPAQLRETAFTCAVDLALADGTIEEGEKSLLEELQRVLEVSDELGKMILQVMLVKNRG